MNRRSFVIVEANARANPANDALIFGLNRETNAVAPTTPLESKLKRIESHLLTELSLVR